MDNKITKILLLILILIIAIFVGMKISIEPKEEKVKQYTYLVVESNGDENKLQSSNSIYVFDENDLFLGVRVRQNFNDELEAQKQYEILKNEKIPNSKIYGKTIIFTIPDRSSYKYITKESIKNTISREMVDM